MQDTNIVAMVPPSHTRMRCGWLPSFIKLNNLSSQETVPYFKGIDADVCS